MSDQRDLIAQEILRQQAGFRDAYPVDVAPATWAPSPYEGWRESSNVEDRREQGDLLGYAGGLGAEALKQIRDSHEAMKRLFR